MVGIVLASSVACVGGSEPGTDLLAGVIPVREGATSGPGTELGAGFEVAEGSVLVGGVLRRIKDDLVYKGVQQDDDGWRAVLVVTEPGRAVFNRYVEQGRAAGFEWPSEVPAQSCIGIEPELSCSASVTEGSPEGWHRSLTILLEQRSASAGSGRPPMSSILISYSDVGEQPSGNDRHPDTAGALPDGRNPGAVPQDGWPPLAGTGETFWAARPETHALFTVAKGSRLLMNTVFGVESAGSITVFEVTDDTVEVLNRYVDQADFGRHRPELIHYERDGATVDWVSWTDGGSNVVSVYQQEGQPAWMLLEAWPTD